MPWLDGRAPRAALPERKSTIAMLSEHVVCFEVKPGPYSAANDKDFAPWAPREGDPEAGAYLEGLVGRFVRTNGDVLP